MKKHHCVTQMGEYFTVLQADDGIYLCPVCGSAELYEPPYSENGSASFQMCSCGFEFGFDDSRQATKEAVDGVVANWDRWRLKVIEAKMNSKSSLQTLEKNLNNIGYRLAFDLIPVKTPNLD